MHRREFLAAGAVAALGGCISAPVSQHEPSFRFDGFGRVTDVDVGPEGSVFVAGVTADERPRVVELNGEETAEWTVDDDPMGDPHVEIEATTLFVSYDFDTMLAVDRDTRSIRWRMPDAGPPSFPVSDGVAFLSVGDRIVAVSVDDGHTRWTYEKPADQYLAPIAVVGDTLVCSGGGGLIAGLSIDDGSEQWTHALGGDLPPTFHGEGTVYAGTGTNAEDPRAVAIDAAAGEIRWTIRRSDGVVSPDVDSWNVYLPSDDPGFGTVAVDPETGEERWQRTGISVRYAGLVGPVGIAGPGEVVALKPDTGEERWRQGMATWDETGPEIELVGRTVIVVDPGSITAVETESGRPRWRHQTRVERHPRIESNGSVVAVEVGGSVLGFWLDE